ncbi:maleylpyruvate isomerase N-terminal domain-containing protein [Dactylosporangium salmoneum]|uniref:Mycothiol-dependent maleylpyruvate isomerase metal-binding domain-containing protein n=1 Tax=Dactylosporangium salmoneum TaxID=53361 RepID=A0ABN3HH16_9ACTN
MPDQTGPREADAFFETLDSTPPDAVTACLGWTTHEMIAHIASGADAFADQIEAHLDGRPVPEFGAWEVREPPYRELSDAVLRRRLVASEQRMSAAFETMLAADAAAAVADIGWGLPIAELVTHMRQEFAIHRWDMIGDDEIGHTLLSRPVLLDHSVRLLSDSLFRLGLPRDPSPQTPLTVRLRCAGEPDLVVDVRDGAGTLALADPAGADHVIETDAAARLLILWGRRPTDPRRVRSALPPDDLARLQTLLAGY